ncbi:hypothetical protein LOD99_9463 [Oopsacas minuta]|uniref:VWFA domain-containing protein n=1 Tax=Oopsacas minuta TaxID=111878 RepID=A0AAV7JBJ2_9METZ|nr:hypothetical protein LOD99_9463 [Oopsacas minuta]
MAVVEKPTENKIKLIATNEYQEYDPSKEVSCWVDIKLEAPIFEEEDNKRAAVDLVAVIDRSGSMDGGKLDLVKKTLHFVVSQLAACDRLALIVFDDNICEIFPLTKITSINKLQIENKINSVETCGSTNLCGGLLKGIQMVIERAGDKADVASVLLLTDGHANVGISSQDGILRAMRTPYTAHALESEGMDMMMPQQMSTDFLPNTNCSNIGGASPLEPADKKHPDGDFEGTVYTFGFGNDHNASLLEEISNQGNGAYYYIDSLEKVPESFASCLGGLLSTVGQNITMTVEITNGCVVKEFTAKNKPKYNEGRTRVEVTLGDLQSEETRDVLMELKLPVSPAAAGDVKYCSVALAYFNVINAVIETIKLDLTVARTNTGKPRVSNPTIDKERNRINITNAIKEAREKARAGEFEKGRDILSACEKQVKSSVTAEDPLCKAMLIDLADCLRGMEDEQSYSSYGSNRMANMAQNYYNQRANFVPDANLSQNVMYQTKAKSDMMKKF